MNSTAESILPDSPLRLSSVHRWWQSFNLAAICILFALVALTEAGNILTIAAVVKFPNLRKRRYMLITSLAAADILVGVSWSFFILSDVYPLWCFKSLANTIELMVITFPAAVSHLHILLMAIDRCIAVLFPLRYETWMSKTRTHYAIAGVWLGGLGYVLIFLPRAWQKTGEDCVYDQIMPPYATLTQLGLYVIILSAIVIIYNRISRTAKRHTTRTGNTVFAIHQTRDSPADDKTVQPKSSRVSTPKATKFMIIVIVTYLGTSCLYFMVALAEVFKPLLATSAMAWHVSLRVAHSFLLLNSCLNVFIYAACIADFRIAFKTMLSVPAENNKVTPFK